MPLAQLNTGPGSIELKRSPEPLVRADKLLFVHFERPDLASAERYLTDFGLVVTARTQTELFMRGTGTTPYIYRVTLATRPRFVGLGLAVPKAEDLQLLAKVADCPIETSDAPGGGSLVRLADPDGVAVHVLHGQTQNTALPLRAALPHNAPDRAVRVNGSQRPPREPPQVTKLGHLVIETPNFDKTARWYMDTLGFIPSDVMCLPDGAPIGAFMRLDRGNKPTDHHTIFVAMGIGPGVDHVAFEVVDLDAVEMGQQVMMAANYRHAWGVGRHLLGSQIFDYWRDPWGQKHEHYADGDLFDASEAPGYHLLDRAGLYQWGPDLPDDFIDARLTLRRLVAVLKIALNDRTRFKQILALKNSVSRPARPWRSRERNRD